MRTLIRPLIITIILALLCPTKSFGQNDQTSTYTFPSLNSLSFSALDSLGGYDVDEKDPIRLLIDKTNAVMTLPDREQLVGRLVWLNNDISPAQQLKMLYPDGWRPAVLSELMAFGVAYKDAPHIEPSYNDTGMFNIYIVAIGGEVGSGPEEDDYPQYHPTIFIQKKKSGENDYRSLDKWWWWELDFDGAYFLLIKTQE